MTNLSANDWNGDTASDQYANAFDEQTDPLAQYSDTFHDLPDPFTYFIENVLHHRESIENDETIEHYRRTFRQWADHIDAITGNRHPACPKTQHVQRFIAWRRDVHGNSRRTIKGKLARLSQAYQYWQDKSMFPHPPNWNPFRVAEKETSLGQDSEKDFHDLTLSDLQTEFSKIVNIRRRAIIGLQLKTGLRAGEACNLKIAEIHISHQDVQQQYPEFGSHPALEDYSDVIYIPHDRAGNKSSNPRLIPIDDELRWLLLRHLLTRPQVDEP